MGHQSILSCPPSYTCKVEELDHSERIGRQLAQSCTVWYSALGNVYMAEIAERVHGALVDLGIDAELATSGLPRQRDGHLDIVVAPHEFFPLDDAHSEEDKVRSSQGIICITTEQPGSEWFGLSARYCRHARAVLDINRRGVEALGAIGIRAHFLPLGYHSSMDLWSQSNRAERPLEVTLLAGITPRRERILAKAAPLLQRHRCELRLFGFEKPVSGPGGGFVSRREKLELLSRSKILLNLHRSEEGYFEWARISEAVANGCVLATEPSTGYEPFVPMKHFLEAPAPALIEMVDALLADEAALSAMRQSAYELLREKLDLRIWLARSLKEALSHDPPSPPAASENDMTPWHLKRARQLASRASSAVEPAGSMASSIAELRAEMKRCVISERRHRREAEALGSTVAWGRADVELFEATPSFASASPQASVVLTVYNYERFVGEAIQSVLSSTGIAAEIVAVDDHSTDGSVETIRALMSANPGFPLLLVRRQANHGLAASRNLGFSLARSEKVFVLDADNSVYPSCLCKLASALDRDPSAGFAYGIIEKFGESDSAAGLVSALPWDPERLAQSNYIDAMAMIRRSTWEQLGGYATIADLEWGGWEDYELWLHIAATKGHGVHVKEILSRYRVHPSSMRSLLDLDAAPMWRALRKRYPLLSWPRAVRELAG